MDAKAVEWEVETLHHLLEDKNRRAEQTEQGQVKVGNEAAQ